MTTRPDGFDPAVQAWQLKRFRSDLGLSQSEAAARLGVSSFLWWRWEEGKRPITEHYRERIREAQDAFRARRPAT